MGEEKRTSASLRAGIARIERMLATGLGRTGKPLPPRRRRELEVQLRKNREALEEVVRDAVLRRIDQIIDLLAPDRV